MFFPLELLSVGGIDHALFCMSLHCDKYSPFFLDFYGPFGFYFFLLSPGSNNWTRLHPFDISLAAMTFLLSKTPIPQRARPLKDHKTCLIFQWSFNELSMISEVFHDSWLIFQWSSWSPWSPNFLKRFKTVFQRSFRKMVFQQSFSDLSMNFQRSY